MPNKKPKSSPSPLNQSPQKNKMRTKPSQKNENKKNEKVRKEKLMDKTAMSTENEEKKRTKVVDLPKQSIPINSLIDTSSDSYFILKKLGSGGFGDVYETMRRSDNKIFAVKVEYVKASPDRRLKKEYELYREITKQKRKGNAIAEHLMEVIDYGECPGVVHFMFMPLCGHSLDSILKTKMPTFATALILTEQTLRSVQNFHSFMHIHRDLKPANFVLGRPPHHNKVFLLDFGMAVRYCIDPKKMPKTSVYDFIGTLRYASRTTHQGMPQTRKDDLESWFYVALELFQRKILPWSNEKRTKAVEIQKDKFFNEMPDSVFGVLPQCFLAIAKAIDGLKMFDQPDYDFIHKAFYKVAKEEKILMNGSLEFVTGVEKSPRLHKSPDEEKPKVMTAPVFTSPLKTPSPIHIIKADNETGAKPLKTNEEMPQEVVITPPNAVTSGKGNVGGQKSSIYYPVIQPTPEKRNNFQKSEEFQL